MPSPASPASRPTGTDPALGPRPGFVAGLRAFFFGLGWIVRTPPVWPLALVPLALAAALAAGLGIGLGAAALAWIEGALPPPSGTTGAVAAFLARALGVVVASVVAVGLAFALAQPLAGPALERIVRRVEREAGAPAWPPTSILDDVRRSIGSVVLALAIAGPLLALLLVVGLAFPPATVVTVPLKVLVTALVLAWDLCDYPLSIRGVPLGARIRFAVRHAPALLGFGAGLALLAVFVPCVVFLLLPAGVAGAARLTVDLERDEAKRIVYPSLP